MTEKELIAAICDANDAGVADLGIYQPALVKATKRKDGVTSLTFKLHVREFSPNDVLNGVRSWIAIGTVAALKRLMEQRTEPKEPTT